MAIFKAVKNAVRIFNREMSRDKDQTDADEYAARVMAEAEEGKKLRYAALVEAGVDLSQFTRQLALDDTREMLEEFLPEALEDGYSLKGAMSTFNPMNLTKAGKVPKNVMCATVSVGPPLADSIICNIKYMADGKVNMAEMTIWRDQQSVSFGVRRSGDSYVIKTIECSSILKDFRKLLYSEKNPDGKDPREVLSSAFEKVIIRGRI